jgi:hypothetical protein
MLVVSSLVIALIMISTSAYVYELAGDFEGTDVYPLNDYVQSIRLGMKNVVVGALANITNGGQNETLAANLDRWKTAVARHYTVGQLTLNYSLRETAPYSSGLCIAWDTDGTGVSEAYVDYVLAAKGNRINVENEEHTNVSLRLRAEGFITQVSPNASQVTVTWRLFNEGQPALAENTTLYYWQAGQWLIPDASNDYVVTDHGNGTYRATFVLRSLSSVDVSVHVLDRRGIVAQTNMTCVEP